MTTSTLADTTLTAYRNAATALLHTPAKLDRFEHGIPQDESVLEHAQTVLNQQAVTIELRLDHDTLFPLDPIEAARLHTQHQGVTSALKAVREVTGALKQLSNLNPEWDLDWESSRKLATNTIPLNSAAHLLRESEPELARQVEQINHAVAILHEYNGIRRDVRESNALNEDALQERTAFLQQTAQRIAGNHAAFVAA